MDEAYLISLKKQIDEKSKLLEVAKKQLQKAKAGRLQNNTQLNLIGLLEAINRIPYQPPRNDLVGIALAKSQFHHVAKQCEPDEPDPKWPSESYEMVAYDRLGQICGKIDEYFKKSIKDKEEERQNTTIQRQNDQLKEKIANLRARCSKLTEYTKLIVTDYLIDKEFIVFEGEEKLQRKSDRFLQLLEILLNNALVSEPGKPPKTLDVGNKDDPMIRYLIVNNIVVVDSKDPNHIRLKI